MPSGSRSLRSRLVTSVAFALCASALLLEPSPGQQPTGEVHPPPVYLDVVVLDKQTKAPVSGLTRDDFQITENHNPVPISSFDLASDGSARPLSVWFVLLCPEKGIGQSVNWNGSDFMHGKAALLSPAIQKLTPRDTVGVAYWCDNGETAITLAPTFDRAAPVAAIESVTERKAVPIDTDRGELVMTEAVRQVRDFSERFNPGATVILIFLYGDQVVMEPDYSIAMLEPLPELPTTFYVLNNGLLRADDYRWGGVSGYRPLPDQRTTAALHRPQSPIRYLADLTGGENYTSARGAYGELLDSIITHLQGRYQLRFLPRTGYGQHHECVVKLSPAGLQKVKSPELHARTMYIPSASPPLNAETQRHAALALALGSNAPWTQIPFDASGRTTAGAQSSQFRLYIDSASLSWLPAPDGGLRAQLSVVTAGLSSNGDIISRQIKGVETLRSSDQATSAKPKATVLSIDSSIPQNAVRIRIVLRDGQSGHMGTFDLPVSQIRSVPAPNPATSSTSKPSSAVSTEN